MSYRKEDLTKEQKIEIVDGITRQVVDIFTNNFYDIFEEDADLAFSKGGCESLAEILKELFPEGEILYSSHHTIFRIFETDFGINGKQPKGSFSDPGEVGFYPISEWTKKEFAPIVGYSLARIRQRWPYFWDDTDVFDKTAQIELGEYLTFDQYLKDQKGSSEDNIAPGM